MDRPERSGRTTTRLARLVDAHVGRRVRERRMDLAISRSELAKVLGISAEQLRRCEAGLASLVASRLHEIGAALSVPASHFFEGIPKDGAKLKATAAPKGRASPTTRELSQLIDAYWQVGDPNLRQQLFSLISTLAAADGQEPI